MICEAGRRAIHAKLGRTKSREEQLTWAKQRALICVDKGAFACAVAACAWTLPRTP